MPKAKDSRWILKRPPALVAITDHTQRASTFNVSALVLLNNGRTGDGDFKYAMICYEPESRVISFKPVEVDTKGVYLLDVVNVRERHFGMVGVLTKLKEFFGVGIDNKTRLTGKWDDNKGQLEFKLDETVATFKSLLTGKVENAKA